MASDSQDSRRKHHRSTSDEESSERSKRRKHRHRRHHHHSRHRHSSRSKKSLDGETEALAGSENGGVPEIFEEAARSANSKVIEYDMEEGEIVDDDVLCEIGDKNKKSGSDVEPTESDVAEVPSGMETSDTIIANGEKNMKIGVNRIKGHGGGEMSFGESDVNADADYQQSDKDDEVYIKSHKKSSSLMKGKSKLKGSNGLADREEFSDSMQVDEGDVTELGTSLSHVSVADGTKNEFRPPHHGSYQDEIYHSRRSISPDRARKKSHSRYTMEEEHSRRSSDHYSYRSDARGLTRDEERERSSSDIRHSHSVDKYFDTEYREKEETMRESGNGKEQDTRVRAREVEREREWSHGRKHENGRELDRKREKVQARSRDLEYDKHRDREKGRGRSGERDLELEHRSLYRDRERERRRDRARDGDERLRDSRTDRHTNNVKGSGSDRNRQYGRYDNYDDHGHRGRSYNSRHGVYDEEKYHEDRHRNYGKEKDRVGEDPLKGTKVERDEDDQDDFSENMLETIDQEEEDINRIKEESRRRREAILQKYRTQLLQKQDERQAKSAEKDISQEPADKRDDHEHDVSNHVFSVGKSPSRIEVGADEKGSGAGGLGEGTPKSEKSNDMFCDDIFADSPAGGHKMGKGDGAIVQRSGLRDNWDDAEGYYSYRLGELLDGRYEITAAHGKGVFSTVVRAKDLKVGIEGPEEVAIKMIRNNDTMLKAGMEELIILKKLVGADPDDRRHCVRYFSSFKYRNHLCLVFESLHMNLREVLKKFGRNIGLKLTAVRAYSKQLFIALKHLKNCGVLHCDIKPDNMLVNDAKNVLKLCDFGNAMFAGKNEVTPYLVSRFYRAPEIILGLQYDHPLDIWSVGCCLYELYTGKVLFPGHTNNEMLRLHMELKGPFSKKMLRKGTFTDQNFDQDFNFLSIEEDPVTKKILRKPVINIKPKDIGNLIKGSPGEDPKLLAHFKDLLDKIFVLDPDKRMTVSQALSHPFITGK